MTSGASVRYGDGLPWNVHPSPKPTFCARRPKMSSSVKTRGVSRASWRYQERGDGHPGSEQDEHRAGRRIRGRARSAGGPVRVSPPDGDGGCHAEPRRVVDGSRCAPAGGAATVQAVSVAATSANGRSWGSSTRCGRSPAALSVASAAGSSTRSSTAAGGRSIARCAGSSPSSTTPPRTCRSCGERRFDLAYTRIVLQHVAGRDLARSYIREFVRVLAPGGIAMFQVPVHIPRRYRLMAVRRLQPALIGRHRAPRADRCASR